MISATMRSCTSGNATSHELKHAGGHDARAPGRSSFRAFSPPPAVLGRASREQLAARQATPLEASRRGFGNRLFALHVFNSTLFFFLSMLTGLGRTKGKKKENRKYTHTKTHAQIRPTHSARPMFIRIAELEPMQRAGGGVTAAWRRHFHSSRNASTRRALHTQSVQQSPASWASSQSPMTKCA